jgi:hypothetical protein
MRMKLSSLPLNFMPRLCPFLAVQQQSPGVTHIRDRLLAGGFAANPFSVGCVRF